MAATISLASNNPKNQIYIMGHQIVFRLFRGDGCWKVFLLFIGCLLRCIISPVFGFLNFFTSVTEGFANALIGDFEQFARMQEQSDLLAKAQRRTSGLGAGAASGALDRRSNRPLTDNSTLTGIPGFGLTYGGSGSISSGRIARRKSISQDK